MLPIVSPRGSMTAWVTLLLANVPSADGIPTASYKKPYGIAPIAMNAVILNALTAATLMAAGAHSGVP
jgi:hypothetical protein